MKTIYLLVSFILFSCSEIIVPESESDLNVEDFESAWNRINDIYPLLEFKKIDWDSIYTEYKVRADESVGDEIYTVLFDLVGELKDGHARIYTEGGESIQPFTPPRFLRDKGAFDPNLIRKYFDKPLQVAGKEAIEYGFLPDNIGYIRFSTFGSGLGLDDIDIVINDLDVIINLFSEAVGLIIDIRNNDGGSSRLYDQIIGRFIDEPMETEPGLSVTGITPSYMVRPQGQRHYTGPIVILINGTSFSAAEVFPDRMSQLDYVTLVGDTTADSGVGFSNDIDPRYFLPSGKSIRIGWYAVLRKDGSIPEGIPPDIRITQTKEDVRKNRDKQLEFAMQFLKK